jgi:hypothetical protein
MAYLARIETTDAQPLVLPMRPAPKADPIVERVGFSPLEWSIVRLARMDRLWTIRPLGPVRRLWNWLTGRGNPALASERLEALRRIAVLSWHFGFTVPGRDVRDFLSAGFTADQYELLVNSVRRAVASPTREFATETYA